MPGRTQPAQKSRNRDEAPEIAALRSRARKAPRRAAQARRCQARNQLRQPDPHLHHAALSAREGSPHESRTRRRPKSSRRRSRLLHSRLSALPPQRLQRRRRLCRLSRRIAPIAAAQTGKSLNFSLVLLRESQPGKWRRRLLVGAILLAALLIPLRYHQPLPFSSNLALDKIPSPA